MRNISSYLFLIVKIKTIENENKTETVKALTEVEKDFYKIEFVDGVKMIHYEGK